MRERLWGLWTWAHGAVPPVEHRDDRLGLLVFIALAACVQAWVHFYVEVRGMPLARGPLRGGVFMGAAVAAILAWHLWSESGLRAWVRAAGAVTVGLVFVPLVVRVGLGLPTYKQHAFAALALGWLGIGLCWLVGRVGARVDWASWGLSMGDWRWWLPRTLVLAVLVVVGTGVVLLVDPGLGEFYPWYRPARKSLAVLGEVQVSVVFDFIGWEFMFRGLLLFGLARRGDIHLAVWAQALFFFALHQGKPETEFIMSLPGGVIAGYYAWRARSFVPLWGLHACQLLTANVVGFWLNQAG